MSDLSSRVYKKLLEVPRGKVTTYAELAKAVGIENGQRAIGNIMNKNPNPILVPCHRVVRSDGSVGGYVWRGKKLNYYHQRALQMNDTYVKKIRSLRYLLGVAKDRGELPNEEFWKLYKMTRGNTVRNKAHLRSLMAEVLVKKS